MTNRSDIADFVTAFATGWPENQPDIMVLSLTTHKGVQDFAFNKEQALLIAKTIKETAAKLRASPKTASSTARHGRRRCLGVDSGAVISTARYWRPGTGCRRAS